MTANPGHGNLTAPVRPILNLGFFPHAHTGWTSGRYHEQDLTDILLESYGDQIGINLLLPQEEPFHGDLDTAKTPLLTYPTVRRWSKTWWQERAARHFFRHDITADRFLQAHNIQALVFGHAPAGSQIPTVGLGPDFQPQYFPEFFAPEELERRWQYLQQVGSLYTRVIVYSNAVREDVARFAPAFLDKTRIVEPVSCIPPHIYDADPAKLCLRYNLPAKFFYVPNQFWQHKNHQLVAEALMILRHENLRPFVVMSGLTIDHRKPDYFAIFLRLLSEAGLRDQVVILGLVPRDDVYGLIRQSIAVINPSLFEGYGLGVSEARWVGKRLLVSDLPSHREQNSPGTMYFDPRSAEMLADQMRQVWSENTPGPDVALETAARSAFSQRKRQYAQDFIRVIQELVPEASRLADQVV